MAVDFKTSNTKAELLEIAAANGVATDDSMTKTQIIAALEAYNAAGQPEASEATDNTTAADNTTQGGTEGAQDTPDSGGDNQATQGTQNAAGQPGTPGETNNTAEGENATQSGTAAENDEYDMFAYVGPTLPRGRLKENAIFRGKIKDVLAYLADVLEDYPQVAKLIVPTHKIAVYSAKVKTPGNVAHKYYTDIVSAMHGNKEV